MGNFQLIGKWDKRLNERKLSGIVLGDKSELIEFLRSESLLSWNCDVSEFLVQENELNTTNFYRSFPQEFLIYSIPFGGEDKRDNPFVYVAYGCPDCEKIVIGHPRVARSMLNDAENRIDLRCNNSECDAYLACLN